MCQVRDVMTTRVITLTPETTAEEAIETLVNQRISGAPVVDPEGRLLGVLTEYHLLKIASFPSLQEVSAGDMMTKVVWVVSEDASLEQAAEMLAKHRIRRLPVIKDGKVVGVISRRDVIRHLLSERRNLTPTSDLSRLCKRLMSAIGQERSPRPKRARKPRALSGAAI